MTKPRRSSSRRRTIGTFAPTLPSTRHSGCGCSCWSDRRALPPRQRRTRLPNELSGLKGKLAKKGIPDFIWGWEPSDTMNASELLHQYRERRDAGAAHGGRRTEVIRFFEVMDYQRFATNLLLETMNVEAATHGLPLPFPD